MSAPAAPTTAEQLADDIFRRAEKLLPAEIAKIPDHLLTLEASPVSLRALVRAIAELIVAERDGQASR